MFDPLTKTEGSLNERYPEYGMALAKGGIDVKGYDDRLRD